MTVSDARPGDAWPDAVRTAFLLSFRQRDELAAAVGDAGWRTIAARRAEGAGQRIAAGGAAVVVLDARGAIQPAIEAAPALGTAAADARVGMLALVSRDDVLRLDELLAAGATHFLASPFSAGELAAALDFTALAGRGGGDRGDRRGGRAGSIDTLGWRWDPGSRALRLTPGLAAAIGSDRAAVALARLDRESRVAARAALARLAAGAASTAFAHDLAPLGRVVQHLQRGADGVLHGLVEPIGPPPDARGAVSQALGTSGTPEDVLAAIDLHAREHGTASFLRVRIDPPALPMPGARAALLRAAGRRIEEAARGALGPVATMAMIGEGEVVVAGAGDDAAFELLGDTVAGTLARPFALDGELIAARARVALLRAAEDRSARTAIEEADTAPARIAHSLDQLATDIPQALDASQITLLFQPQVEIASGRIVGVEALARWQHAALGEIGAETLLAAADRAGLADALSDHILRSALRAASAWPAVLAGQRLAVNITASDIARAGFADRLLGMVDDSGFPRSRLTVEVTETGLIEELGEAAKLLSTLRQAGCRVAIDDFGTGYSSLAYLKALPLDYLKIDRRLSQDIAGSPRDRIVVRGVIEMARSLGLAVIAEGVETDEQLDLLAAEGCQYFQGFLRAGPVDADTLAGYVAAEMA